jgi:DNA polymerase-3 subunit delta'
MSELVPWPETLIGTPAVSVIEQAIARQKLSHSVLLHGDNHDTLVGIANAIADRLLNVSYDPRSGAPRRRGAGEGGFPPDQHPDSFALRPAGKMRQISADATRDLINKIQVSPAVAPRKVAILHEVDRMHVTAANVFLKTLEEPPANTTLLLLTTRPYALLPTIRSRVLHFRFPSTATALAADGWAPWLEDYRSWLERLVGGPATDKKAVADHVFTLYGLVARFGAVLEAATSSVWEQQKEKLPADLTEEQKVAIETGIANGLRARLFAEIEQATRQFAIPRLLEGDDSVRRALSGAIEKLEHNIGLLRLNLNESAALEDFLLSSLRLWARR